MLLWGCLELMDIVSKSGVIFHNMVNERTETRLSFLCGGSGRTIICIFCPVALPVAANLLMNFRQSGLTFSGPQGQLWITGPDLERAPHFDDAFISGDNVPPPPAQPNYNRLQG